MRILLIIIFSFLISVSYGDNAMAEGDCFSIITAKYYGTSKKIRVKGKALPIKADAWCKITLKKAVRPGGKATHKKIFELATTTFTPKEGYNPETGKEWENNTADDMCMKLAKTMKEKFEKYNKESGKAHCMWLK
jgi:hypothetical protein